MKVYVVKLFTYGMRIYVVLLCFLSQGLIPPGGLYPKPLVNEIETGSLSNPLGYWENSTIHLDSNNPPG